MLRHKIGIALIAFKAASAIYIYSFAKKCLDAKR